MGWRDRDYNRGREGMYAFFGNPGSLLASSVPFGSWPGLSIRIHFWLLLFFIFDVVSIIREHNPLYYIPVDFALIIGILLFHEWGHRVLSQRVGGNHFEWVLWPLGGMIKPHAPSTPWATFVANVGGIAFTAPLGAAFLAGILTLSPMHHFFFIPSPFQPVGVLAIPHALDASSLLLTHLLTLGFTTSVAIVSINLFPAYWFDGGPIWQSILWPRLGPYRAMMVTCMAGMVLSVPCFLLALWGTDFFGLIIWALIFSDCFNRRRALATAGPGALDEEENTYNYMDTSSDAPRRKRKGRRGWFRNASRKAAQERAEQARIDAILEKVHLQGLHSLTWFEKLALRKATERQRRRERDEDLISRL